MKLSVVIPAWNGRAYLDGNVRAILAFLAERGMTLIDSTAFLAPFMAGEGTLTRRAPTPEEQAKIGPFAGTGGGNGQRKRALRPGVPNSGLADGAADESIETVPRHPVPLAAAPAGKARR